MSFLPFGRSSESVPSSRAAAPAYRRPAARICCGAWRRPAPRGSECSSGWRLVSNQNKSNYIILYYIILYYSILHYVIVY